MLIYLIPSELFEGEVRPIPSYVQDAVKECQIFFVENERTARRYLKRLWKDMVIDNYEWVPLKKGEEALALTDFEKAIKSGKTIGILSEAGCPGVADPGQLLVAKAQALDALIKPLVGPSSVLLALMASGLNGQNFTFNGYLPIDGVERKKAIQRMEEEAFRKGTTHIFIETPYRNEPLLKSLLENCRPETMLCIAANLTSQTDEYIRTFSIKKWKGTPLPSLHKIPCIFLIGAS